jgi:hypothetical protein
MEPGPQANSHNKENKVEYFLDSRKDSQNEKEWKKELQNKYYQNQSKENLLQNCGGNSRDLDIGLVNNGNNYLHKAAIQNINPFGKETPRGMGTKNPTTSLYEIPNETKHWRDCVPGKKSPYLPTDVYKDHQPGTYNIMAEKLREKLKQFTDQPRGPNRSCQVNRNLHSFDGNPGHRQGANSIDNPTGKRHPADNTD